MPPRPPEAAGGRQKQRRASQRDANPAHRVWASASWPWLPAGPDGNFTWRAPTIARTISASQCSAISVPDGSRSVTASCMRHRPRHTRQPEPELGDGHEHVQLGQEGLRRKANTFLWAPTGRAPRWPGGRDGVVVPIEPVLIAEVNFFGRHKGGALRDGVLLSAEEMPVARPIAGRSSRSPAR
jgi:hypothetical protein